MGKEGFGVFLNQLIQSRLFRAPSLVVNGIASRYALSRLTHDLFLLLFFVLLFCKGYPLSSSTAVSLRIS